MEKNSLLLLNPQMESDEGSRREHMVRFCRMEVDGDVFEVVRNWV